MIDDDEEYLLNQQNEVLNIDVPETTKWEHKCSCLGFDFNEISENHTLYCNEWEVSYFPTSYVVILIVTSLIEYFIILRKYSYLQSILIDLCIFAMNALFLFSYIAAILEGPGFLPFYYPMKMTPRSDGLKDYLSGVVSNKEQENYVKSKPKLKRCGYFSTAKRYVLRPDHFCGWTCQFIGKKNYKLFIHFNLWGALYTTVFSICSFIALIKEFTFTTNVVEIIITLIYLMQSIFFATMTWGFLFTGLYNTHFNTTQFEQMANIHTKPQERCIDNWQEVCGSAEKWYTWLLPIPPFRGKSPEYLLTHNY